jgi:hypothetical protein
MNNWQFISSGTISASLLNPNAHIHIPGGLHERTVRVCICSVLDRYHQACLVQSTSQAGDHDSLRTISQSLPRTCIIPIRTERNYSPILSFDHPPYPNYCLPKIVISSRVMASYHLEMTTLSISFVPYPVGTIRLLLLVSCIGLLVILPLSLCIVPIT